MKQLQSKLILLILFVTMVGLFIAFDLKQYISLDTIKMQQDSYQLYYNSHPMLVIGLFFASYVLMTGLSLPGATVLTLLAGALFGVATGSVVVSFASSIGASLAMVVSRFLLKDWVEERHGNRINKINEGIDKEGIFYLFALRLTPVIPFFVINLLFGLTRFPVWKFYLISQIGMIPATILYVYTGTQLAQLESLSDILSFHMMIALMALGFFPIIAKKWVDYIRRNRVLKPFSKPTTFDYNLVVIGAGAAGLVSSYIAAAVNAKVALIEKHRMGGDCLNTGCVPSKALIKSAQIAHNVAHAKDYGIQVSQHDIQTNFKEVMHRVHSVIHAVEPHDSVERYSKLGVECISGEAMIKDPYRVEVDGRTLTTRNIIVATGARPLVPPIPGLDDVGYLTSDTLWECDELPKRLLVLGGGPIGCELAQAFARLGSQVQQVEMADQLLGREDKDVSQWMSKRFAAEGITVHTQTKANKFVVTHDGTKQAICERDGQDITIEFDILILALGRQANMKGFGLEELGVKTSLRGTIEADSLMRTSIPTISVCGDVTGPYQLTHVAAHQAWYASVNALFRPFKSFDVDYRVIPWATFTDPEVARVGINEVDAKQQNIAVDVTRYDLDDLDRAIADGKAEGFIKILTVPGEDKILGVTIVGDRGGDLIAPFVLAMKHGLGLNKILGTIHIYPTWAEANKYVAGRWKQEHVSPKILSFLKRFHQFRRGSL